ncbi:hypothetical protein MMC09_002350 [Bachmanniomyces sp. S44760]|nr:hypothetical protein [Bachmanniomyces sp. S44760]
MFISSMNSPQNLVRRDSSNNPSAFLTPTINKLLIALIVLLLCGFLLIGGLYIVRYLRRSQQSRQQSELPLYNTTPNGRKSNHRRLTITATNQSRQKNIYVTNEKEILIENSNSPPPSPLPEIRITFPEERDNVGNEHSGRSVILHISENGGIGMEPVREEKLPPYQTNESDRFQSLDLERIGGLKEHGQRLS